MASVWIDIDNPPQVQYLVPVAAEFERRGHQAVITARDNSITHQLLRDRAVSFLPVGQAFGRSKWRKVAGVLGRALQVRSAVRGARPRLLVSASRSAALAARTLGIPGFMICDYEYVELGSFAKLGSYVAFPDVIDPAVFHARGFAPDRTLPFPGLKEHLTFHGRDIAGEATFTPPDHEPGRPVVAFRPPAAETHYYKDRSNQVYDALVDHLAAREDIHVVFLPRYGWQADQLRARTWRCPLHIPEQPIPPVPLLKGADLVISSGGTMLREAAVLGVPAYSIFQSTIGAVDKELERQGRLVLIGGPDDFGRFRFVRKAADAGRVDTAATMDRLVGAVLDRSGLA